MRWSIGRSLAAGYATLSLACVSSDAGYSDVRQLTADRLQKDVRWYEHESSATGRERTRGLLGQPLDAESAVQIALLNNQGLQAAFEELGIARSRMVSALRLPNPTVDAALRYRLDDSDEASVEVDALIDITALVFLPFQSGAAGAALDAAAMSVAGRVLDIAFQTRVAFFEYQAAEQTLELRSSILAALRASFEVADRLHRAGTVTDLSLANERALYEDARVAYTQAEAHVRARREQVNAWMGLWGSDGANWRPRERLAEPNGADVASQLESRSISRSLDLELSRRRFAASARTANLQRARGWVPELRAGVSAEHERETGEDWAVGPAIAIEVPLFYQGQGETGVALAQMRQEQHRYADTSVRIRAAARATSSRLEAAAKNAAYYKDVLLPLRQQIVDETQLQFNAMNVGVFQLLQAKRDQIETARAYVEALLEYWRARAEVEQLLAGRLPTGGDVPTEANDDEAAPSSETRDDGD